MEEIIQAIILAAGIGKRLGKYTKDNTKCMVKINGKPLIIHVLEKLKRNNIKKVVMVVGYKKENLIRFLKNEYNGIKIEYIENPIYDKTNNIYSLYLAKHKLIEKDTILLESDLIFEEKILTKLINDDRKNLVVVDKYQIWMDGTCVTLDEEDNIIGFFGKSDFKFQKVNEYYKTVNIYKFSKEFNEKVYVPFLEAYMKAMGTNEYYETVLKVISNLGGTGLKALKLNGEKWYEIDDAHDKENSEIIFSDNPKRKLHLIQKRYGGYWRFLELKDFCYLVNPYFPNEKIQEEMKVYLYEILSKYPSGTDTLSLLAGKIFEVEPENIIVTNGASEIINILGKVIDGDFGLTFPTFNEYPESIGFHRIKKYIPNNINFKYTENDLLINFNNIKNIILINPDNPSGNYIPKNEILHLCDECYISGKNIILDESFIDFVENAKKETMISQDIIDKYPNLIIIKSLSKSYGVPGARLGILVTSNKKLLNFFKKELPIWNVNSFGEFFLQIIGKYKENYIISCKKIIQERKKFYKELLKIPYLRVIPTNANYFLCELNDIKASTLAETLLYKYNILIKNFKGKIGLEKGEYIRIAIRDSSDNDYLINVLKNILKDLNLKVIN